MSQNVALNKMATSFSYIKPYEPTRAVDGSMVCIKRWLGNTPNWLCVDLGKPTWIGRWVLRQMGNIDWSNQYNLTNYKLQGSNDNVNWTDLDVVASPLNLCDRMINYCCYRYFRVSISSGLSVNPRLASIAEFELYDCNLLDNIITSQGTLTPTFRSNIFSYTTNVGYDVSSITVTPIALNTTSVIVVNGIAVVSGSPSSPIPLNVGTNNILVQVADTTRITYTITVTRASNPYLKQITVGGFFGEAVVITTQPNQLSYSTKVSSNVTSVKIKPSAYDTGATIKVNNVVVANDTLSSPISIVSGSNLITIDISSAIGEQQVIYQVTVNK